MATWTFPADLEDALWAAARAELPEGALDPRALHAAIVERTRVYTTARDELQAKRPTANASKDLAARALFFTVADAAKVAIPIAELANRGLLPATEALRVLDVGAGCGAMTLGLTAALPDRRLDVTAVDRDERALAILARAVPAARVALQTRTADLAAFTPNGSYDLIVAGTVFNELPPAQRLPLATRLIATLDAAGALILIEPALRETSRALHELRDALLTARAAHVFAPCTRTAAPCPALADERDWCHEDRPFTPPPRLAQLIRATGLRRDGLKFAYLTLRRDATPLVAAPPHARALRVVSDALDQKGTIERILCGDAGRTRRRLLRRDRNHANCAFGDARRGDVIIEDASGALSRQRPADR